MIVRGGIPKPIHATAPQVPAAPLSDANGLAPFQFLQEQKTVWLRIVNTSAVPLRIFPKQPDLDPAKWISFFELAAGEGLEGSFEFTDMWLAGVGGAASFKALLGLRII
jgi:hypothetical protein